MQLSPSAFLTEEKKKQHPTFIYKSFSFILNTSAYAV